MSQTILLTGGAGFIGSHIAVELLQGGYDVVIADDLSNSRADVIDRIEKITGRRPAFYRIDAAPAVFLGIVFIPAFDTVRVFCVRMAAGLSPFYPDRRHIHHKLLRIGLTHLQGTLVIVVLQACFILLNFLLRNVNINLLFGINLVLGVLLIQGLNALGGRIDVSSQHIAQNRVQNNSEK